LVAIARKFLAQPTAIGTDHVIDLVHHDAFAGRPALMNAQVLISIELALPMENTDFSPIVSHNAAFAIRKFCGFGDKYFPAFNLAPAY